MVEEELIKCIQRIASDEEKERVTKWLAESPDHQKAFDDLATIVHRGDYLMQQSNIDETSALFKVKGQLRKQSYPYWMKGVAVAAMLILLLSVSYFFELFYNVDQSNPIANTIIQPGEFKAALKLNNGQIVYFSENELNDIQEGEVLIEHHQDEGIIYNSEHVSSGESEALIFHTLKVSRGEEFKLVLADGTKVWLNSETELRFPVEFTGTERRVFVTGEAYFEVAHNPEKPFRVQAGQTETTALGTAFNVMNYDDDDRVVVTLVEGKVQVQADENKSILLPGTQVEVDNTSLQMKEKSVKTYYYTSWKDGLFDFNGMELEDLAISLGRWYNVEFVFENEEAKKVRFTGAIKRDNPIDFTLKFIQSTSDLTFNIEGRKIIVRK